MVLIVDRVEWRGGLLICSMSGPRWCLVQHRGRGSFVRRYSRYTDGGVDLVDGMYDRVVYMERPSYRDFVGQTYLYRGLT